MYIHPCIHPMGMHVDVNMIHAMLSAATIPPCASAFHASTLHEVSDAVEAHSCIDSPLVVTEFLSRTFDLPLNSNISNS